MGLFGRIFGKQTAKAGLAMHIRSAKYYAKRSKRTARATKKAYNNQQKLVLDLEQAMRENPISLKKIVETTNKFIQSCSDEAKELYEIAEDAFTLEYKIVKELSKLIKDMEGVSLSLQSSLKSHPNLFTGDASNEISELTKLFTKIEGQITLEKRQMKDLRRNKEKMRDRSWKTDDMLLNSLKRSARKEKRKVKKTDDVLDELHKLINHIKEVPPKYFEMIRNKPREEVVKMKEETYVALNKKLNDDLPKLKAEIAKLKEDIEDELTFLSRILTAEVVLMERMKELNQEKIDKIKFLRNQGFPKKAFNLIEDKQQEFLKFLKRNEMKALNNAKALSSMVD